MNANSRTYSGRCHCGNVRLAFESRKSPEELGVRACGCSFCRSHGARTTSDNAGQVTIDVAKPKELNRYQFGLHTADFLICRNCGAYLGAVFKAEGRTYATLNTRFFEDAGAFPKDATPARYEAETADARRARRVKMWTPVLAIRDGNGGS